MYHRKVATNLVDNKEMNGEKLQQQQQKQQQQQEQQQHQQQHHDHDKHGRHQHKPRTRQQYLINVVLLTRPKPGGLYYKIKTCSKDK